MKVFETVNIQNKFLRHSLFHLHFKTWRHITSPFCRLLDEPTKDDILLDKNSRTVAGVVATKAKVPAKELYMSKSRYMPGIFKAFNVL